MGRNWERKEIELRGIKGGRRQEGSVEGEKDWESMDGLKWK